ncbi:TrkA C-terminal domain-containing protein [Halobacterium sp. KA-4]|uniref:TrkA C-terminal domain-containing protein n=1 Tax=Halobacterium sp. KA-4 TaxID=2896367 RepID=UPI001E368900|nr:TrkA C-terminal domain-containing protein [Halobacterium sp. KA-4]MCD2200081.1 TrkA C-terminal domain-containing protein [Halobacterium sp. KA-4]
MPVSTTEIAQGGGVILAAGVSVAVLAAAFRWYFRQELPSGVALLVNVSVVAFYLNTRVALGQAIAGRTDVLSLEAVVFNLAVFGAAVLVAPAARRGGDRVGIQILAATGVRELEGDVGRLVKAVGRAVAVELPEEIEDIEGYDPVADNVKAELSGKTLIFPRRLTVEELRERVVTRLKDDYEVGYVDVELADDGTATYLALGSRTAGIGPTLPPGTAAVGVHADPPNAAGPGDLVQVWQPSTKDQTAERVATAEIRATREDTVTLSLDEYDARKLAGGDYRLLTLPYEPGADRQFASLLRAADETMVVVTVEADSSLDGATVATVDGTVVAVRSEAGVSAIPSASRTLTAGDTLYVVARPDVARRVDAAAAVAEEPAEESPSQ